ncbi:unnamed protein product [Anisakis simplex]|uniref:Uncharacterized protein n=1 Tax=Anisakis simplex TaxID=6269 RepID=A0A3P6SYK0_ANISI|nr:unnamed protein product [Anisakis simplex]
MVKVVKSDFIKGAGKSRGSERKFIRNRLQLASKRARILKRLGSMGLAINWMEWLVEGFNLNWILWVWL